MTEAALILAISQGFQRLVQIIKGSYVQKVTGKGLSTNDYTNADKQRLQSLGGPASLSVSGVRNGDTVPHGFNTLLVSLLQARDADGLPVEGISLRPLTAGSVEVVMPAVDTGGTTYLFTGRRLVRYHAEIAAP